MEAGEADWARLGVGLGAWGEGWSWKGWMTGRASHQMLKPPGLSGPHPGCPHRTPTLWGTRSLALWKLSWGVLDSLAAPNPRFLRVGSGGLRKDFELAGEFGLEREELTFPLPSPASRLTGGGVGDR